MALTKKFLKSKPVCKVGFRLPADAANGVSKVHLVGEFNDWKIGATPIAQAQGRFVHRDPGPGNGPRLPVPLPHQRLHLGERLGSGSLRVQPVRQLRELGGIGVVLRGGPVRLRA